MQTSKGSSRRPRVHVDPSTIRCMDCRGRGYRLVPAERPDAYTAITCKPCKGAGRMARENAPKFRKLWTQDAHP
jgi:DnaJ-class molecular chaperone